MPVATKMDLLTEEEFKNKIGEIERIVRIRFFAGKFKNRQAELNHCKPQSAEELVKLMSPAAFSETSIALTERHKKAVTDAIENITEAIKELRR